MPIKQITTSNTFAQWLTATQALIENQNYYESNLNLVISTANSTVLFVANSFNTINSIIQTGTNTINTLISSANGVYNNTVNVFINTSSVFSNTQNVFINTTSVFSNTVNVFSNTQNVFSNTVNTFNSIQAYVSTAYDTANSALIVSQQASNTANLALAASNAATSNLVAAQAYIQANAAFDRANLSFTRANTSFDRANAAFTQANASFTQANTAFDRANTVNVFAQAAFNKANTVSGNIFSSIAVSGQSNVVANSNSTTLIFEAGENITITTDNATKKITLSSTAGIPPEAQSVAAIADTLVLRDQFADAYANNFYANNFFSTSDQNLKENIRPIEHAVNTVIELRGVRFNWKGSSIDQLGMIAQEVQMVLPEIVSDGGTKSVNYAVVVSVLIEAVKELNERIRILENK